LVTYSFGLSKLDLTVGNDWEIVLVPIGLAPRFSELRDWLVENIDNTPQWQLPDKFRIAYICSSKNWYLDLDDSNPRDQKWKIGFKNPEDVIKFKLIWL